MPDHLLDLAHRDPRLARALQQLLTELSENGSDKLREMARAALDGASLRELALSETYGNEISDAFDHFWTSYQQMSPDERAELEEQGQRQLDAITDNPTP